MPYVNTLAEAKNSYAIKSIANSCPSSAQFLSQINEAQRRLLRRGSWYGTEVLSRFCSYDKCITWPRWVGTVEGVRLGNGQGASVQNQWYSILRHGFNYGLGSGFMAGWNGGYGLYAGWGCGDAVLEDVGQAPTYNKVSGCDGKYIRAFAVKREDYGKTIRIFGTDSNGQPLQERDSANNWVMGLTLTLGDTTPTGFVSTSILVKTITSVVKDITQGRVYLYEYDAANDVMRDLAFYEPSETNPSYRQTKLVGSIFGCVDSTGACKIPIEALVKLNFVPALVDSDFLLIDNFDALKLMIMSIQFEERGDVGQKDNYEKEAVRELNLELRDKFPIQTTVVVCNPVGRTIRSPF